MRARQLLMAVLIAAPMTLRAAAVEEDARAIIQEAQKRTTAPSERYEGLLQSFDPSGKTSEKRWVFQQLGSFGQAKTVIRFNAPAEVKGVALLIVNHPDRASDQWMWTPALERDRRIALQDRSTRFFGTDFSFEDLEQRDTNQYDYRSIGTEAIDGAPCWKIEATPKQAKSSQYTKMTIWVRKDNYAWARVEMYVKDQIVRRLNYGKLTDVQGIWTALELTMTDLRRGTATRLALDKVTYNVPLKDDDFTLQAIRRQ